MALSSARWKRYAESRFPHEREALEFLAANLPDCDPVFLISNFEFIADDGTVNDIDAFVITRQGVFVVELKSRGGSIAGNRHVWHWEKDGRTVTDDSPLILVNSKARKLADLIGRQKAFRGERRPWLEALVFSSDPSISVRLADSERMRICTRLPLDKAPGILPALLKRESFGLEQRADRMIDRGTARLIHKALEEAGIRPSQRQRRVGDYVLTDLIEENQLLRCQDFAAEHPTSRMLRRVRVYNIASAESAERDRIKEAARREFTILERLDHRGILKAPEFKEHELGPAVIFRREPNELRLDHFLAQRWNTLTLDNRLDFVRQLAEALKYAHAKRIVHRALTPRSVLVTVVSAERYELKIFNWQLGRPIGSTSATTGTRSATLHPAQVAEGSHLVYLAPEALQNPRAQGETIDVFSLGAIAFHIFSGKPPASTVPERDQILAERGGLTLSAVLDGVLPELDELIHESTRAEVLVRTESVTDFLKLLEKYEERATLPDEERTVSPLDARPGDMLQGGYKVQERFGTGSGALALLVSRDGAEMVLKIARSPEYNKRILAEHDALVRLRYPRIVEPLPQPIHIGDLAGFLMERAGEQTLAERLQKEGRLSLDLLQRFGEDLLGALSHLEERGIAHRDLKPENIGVGKHGKNKELHLKLFDFSLSNAPLDQVRCGTPPYLEPFLQLKERGQRWDTAAERFSAAMVLYEMATGTHPVWGDGKTAPQVTPPGTEAKIEAELIDAPVRDALFKFFTKALRRNPAERFDNASEMAVAWHHAFASAAATDSRAADIEHLLAAAADVELEARLSGLPLSTRAQNALDRIGAFTVGGLLRLPPSTFFNLKGVGHKTRREIIDLVAKLRERFPEAAVPVRETAAEVEPVPLPEGVAPLSVDDLLPLLVATARTKAERTQRERVLKLLELEDGHDGAPTWPSQTDVANRLGKTRALVGQDITRARLRWRKTPAVTELRNDITQFLREQGGVASADEIAQFVLSARGSQSADAALRLRRAAAAVRCALEAERVADRPRWAESRAHQLFLVALDEPNRRPDDQFQFSWKLAEAAKAVALADSLPSPTRALEALRSVPGAPAEFSDARLLRLAAAVGGVALSPRSELYPVEMKASRALKLAQSSLAGLAELKPEDIQERVRERYPEAEALPGRPALDELLRDAGLPVTWDEKRELYVTPRFQLETVSSSFHREPTIVPTLPLSPPPLEVPPDIQQAIEFEQRLRHFYDSPSYLVLSTDLKRVRAAEQQLLRVFPLLDVFNFDAQLIAALRARAGEFGVDWNVVLRADSAPRDSQDWRRLQLLLDRTLPDVERKICERMTPVLITYPGLLARYARMSVLERLADEPMDHGVWVLIAGDKQTGYPTLDRMPVPARGSNQAADIPLPWIGNRHRSYAAGDRS